MKINKLQKYFSESGLKCNLIFLPEVDSTNDFAKDNLIQPPALIITPYQKKGRGRFSNQWFSECEKNITMTIVQDLIVEEKQMCVVNFYAGVIIYNVLKEEFPDLDITLKWQNDILINGKKTGGILTEVVRNTNSNEKNKFLSIGIGINVNQDSFPDELRNNKYKSKNATSLFLESGKCAEIESLAFKIYQKFFIYYDAVLCPERILFLWKNFSNLIGKNVEFIKSDDSKIYRGKIFDIEIDGAIIILSDTGEKFKFYSGEVHLIY